MRKKLLYLVLIVTISVGAFSTPLNDYFNDNGEFVEGEIDFTPLGINAWASLTGGANSGFFDSAFKGYGKDVITKTNENGVKTFIMSAKDKEISKGAIVMVTQRQLGKEDDNRYFRLVTRGDTPEAAAEAQKKAIAMIESYKKK